MLRLQVCQRIAEITYFLLALSGTVSYRAGFDLYRICEVEANFFAAELLMPEPILVELFKRGCKITEEFLIKHFEVSREAAKKRIELLRKAYDWNNFNRYPDSYNYDDIIVEKYKKFIDSIAPQKFKYGYSFEQDLELEKQRETWV